MLGLAEDGVAARIAVELHEDQVPELQIPVALAAHLAVGTAAADLFSLVNHDLGTGPARARIAHSPEVVFFTQPDDPIFGQNLSPEMEGLIVIEIDGGPQLVCREAPLTDQEVPSHLDRPFFEIVTEGEIT
jgi:hypothetical protein